MAPYHRLSSMQTDISTPSPRKKMRRMPEGFLASLIYNKQGVWWDSNDGCSGLLDSLCDLCVQKYGEFSSRKLVENIRYIGKHGTNEHKMLIWMVSFAHDTQMQQFVCGLDASGSRMQPAPVERYQGPDGAFKCAECPVAVHNYLHWLYREILYWFWSGHEDTRRLFASIRSFWVHGMSQSFQAPVVVQTLENH